MMLVLETIVGQKEYEETKEQSPGLRVDGDLPAKYQGAVRRRNPLEP